MKTRIIATMLGLLLLALPLAAQIEFSVDFTGTITSGDRFAAQHLIAKRNENIAAQNKRLASDNAAITAENERRVAQEPPLAALPLKDLIPVLKDAPAGALKASYLSLMKSHLDSLHRNLVREQAEQEARNKLAARWQAATPAQRAAALAALPPTP